MKIRTALAIALVGLTSILTVFSVYPAGAGGASPSCKGDTPIVLATKNATNGKATVKVKAGTLRLESANSDNVVYGPKQHAVAYMCNEEKPSPMGKVLVLFIIVIVASLAFGISIGKAC